MQHKHVHADLNKRVDRMAYLRIFVTFPEELTNRRPLALWQMNPSLG
jgi:hypothetical protein